jgi:hypothetical protein
MYASTVVETREKFKGDRCDEVNPFQNSKYSSNVIVINSKTYPLKCLYKIFIMNITVAIIIILILNLNNSVKFSPREPSVIILVSVKE